MRKLLLLRPQPGLTASEVRARTLGLEVIACPLFELEAVAWSVPDPAGFDALLITSASAIRLGGPALHSLSSLPVHAVGAASAGAALGAGFAVGQVGDGDAPKLLAELPADIRLLHLCGEDHRQSDDPRITKKIVYRAAMIERPALPPLDGLAIAVHSPRAGERLAQLASDRSRAVIAAISPAAAAACSAGWERVESAAEPNDNSLLALAAMLCHTSP